MLSAGPQTHTSRVMTSLTRMVLGHPWIGRVQTDLRLGLPMAIEGVLKQGFITEKLDNVINWTRAGIALADDLWTRMLRGRDDARWRIAL